MSDLISRQVAIDALEEYEKRVETAEQLWTIRGCKDEILKLPSAKPERKKGKWIYDGEYKNGMMRMKCSICGTVIETFDSLSRLRYCQNCGAKMEDKE